MKERLLAALDLSFSESDFQAIRALVRARAGIALSEQKRMMVYRRLSRRLRQLGLASFEAYVRLLDEDPRECQECLNAITTGLTSFFRERHHFDYLERHLLPDLLHTENAPRRVRAWSAGCSTGEEAFSLAMVLAEALPAAEWDVKVLATDVNHEFLERATRGVYEATSVGQLSPERLKRWFLRGTGPNRGLVCVKPELGRLVSFRRLNLHDDWPMRNAFDLIFCRNVLIYFDQAHRERLVSRLAGVLPPGGHIFLGHSESLVSLSNEFEWLGSTIYRKRTPGKDTSR